MNLNDCIFVGGGISVLFVCLFALFFFFFIFGGFFVVVVFVGFFKTMLFFWNSKFLKACAGNTDGAGPRGTKASPGTA